ncbi:hypothetical protein [Mycolicibacterium sp. PDY-3]|uniref:hypothetical protein n=1 Tax=Mycolicibacterium sp. PDY-3 TaxID=3376069 RepID=UPI00378B86D2
MTPTGNPAYALRNILQAVMGSGGQTVLAGWEAVLHAKSGTLLFAQRHSEVVALFNRVYDLMLALPADVEGRNQCMECVPAWYAAIVYRHSWANTSHPASSLGDAQAISQLTALGLAFELHSLSTPRPSDTALSRLRASLDDWDALLVDLAVNEKLANELRAGVRRLRFLLEDEVLKTFGTEPVMDASQQLAGAAVGAMGRTSPSVAKRIGVVAAATVAILHGAHGAVDDANGFLEGVEELSTRVVELWHPQQQIEGPKESEVSALPPGTTTDVGIEDDDVIDVETVDEIPHAELRPRGQG